MTESLALSRVEDLVALIDRARRDEPGAWADLVGRIRPELGRRLRADPSGVGPDASDIVQESLIALFRHIDEFRGRTDPEFWAWLGTIARRKRSDARRQANRRRPEPLPFDSTDEPAQRDPDDRPSQHAARREEDDRRAAALMTLGVEDRAVLELRHHRELPWAEVAAGLGTTVEAARKRFHRALRRWVARISPIDP